MAGRPRTTARNTLNFSKRFQEYRMELERIIPGKYLQDPEPKDEVHAAWLSVHGTALGHNQAVWQLHLLLKDRTEKAEAQAKMFEYEGPAGDGG